MNTKESLIITISREVGSGGRTVGKKLAERLGIRYSDKQLIQALEEKFGLSAAQIEKLKGEKKRWFDDFLNFVAPVPTPGMFVRQDTARVEFRDFRVNVTTEDVYKAEREILNGIADCGPCVIAGRSAFFILGDRPDKVDILITASRDRRVRRIMEKQELSEEQALHVIREVDTARENYVRRYTSTSRYDARNYDLVINMDNLTEDAAVDLILKYIGR